MTIAIIEGRSASVEIFCMTEYGVSFVLETHMSVICLLVFC